MNVRVSLARALNSLSVIISPHARCLVSSSHSFETHLVFGKCLPFIYRKHHGAHWLKFDLDDQPSSRADHILSVEVDHDRKIDLKVF